MQWNGLLLPERAPYCQTAVSTHQSQQKEPTVKLIDAADAEAIREAVLRPNMRFVPIKEVEQQAVLALHRRIWLTR